MITIKLNKFSEFIKFGLVGGFCSVIQFLSYRLFLLEVHYIFSHVLSFLLAVTVSFLLNSKITFKKNIRITKFFPFVLVYTIHLLLSTLIVFCLVEILHIPEKIVTIIPIILLSPFTFILSKFVLTKEIKSSFQQINSKKNYEPIN